MSKPPKIPVYIGDGLGGADGVDSAGNPSYKSPSQLKNYWMTDPVSQKAFADWCYGVSD